jgi:hypothetical protein
MGDNEEHWQVLKSGEIVVSNTPLELWNAACKYFLWCDTHPVIKKRTIATGKAAGTKVDEESARPYTIKGLCLHCGIMEDYLKDVRNCPNKNDPYYIVVSRILYIIYTQMAEQAVVGNYNPIFTAKMLNMDAEDNTVSAIKIDIVEGLPKLSTSENQILEKLESEISTLENSKEQKF